MISVIIWEMQRKERFDVLVLIVLLLATVLVQYLFINPPILSDQMEYYQTAVEFPHLPEKPNIASMRLGLILPVAVLYRVFGHSELAYYGLPVLSTVLFILSVYWIGKGLFNRRVGFFAAIWVLLIPNLLLNAGHLLPDVPAAAFLTAGFAILVAAHPWTGEPRAKAAKGNWLYFLAGLFFGWSYLIKEYMAVLFLLIPVLFWALDIPFRRLLPTVYGMLLIFGFEMAVGWIYYQDPLIRFQAASPRDTVGHIETDVGLIIRFFPYLLNRNGGIGTLLLSAIGLAGSVFYAIKKNKAYIFLLTWTLVFYVFFTFIGLLPVIFSWEDTVLLRLHKFRYWVPILPPLVISGIAFLDQFSQKAFAAFKLRDRNIHLATYGMLAILLLISSWIGIAAVSGDPNLVRNGADHYLELREFLRSHADQVDLIWVTRESRRGYVRILPIYTHNFWGKPIWDGTIKYLNTEGIYLRADELQTGCVIIDRDFNNPNNYDIPRYLAEPPQDWRLIFESENQKLALYALE